jgi:hypothetical protein
MRLEGLGEPDVAGLIPDEVIGFFNSPNLSSRTVAQGFTRPLTEMSISNLPGQTTFGEQSRGEITSGGTRTKTLEHHWCTVTRFKLRTRAYIGTQDSSRDRQNAHWN